MIRVLVALSPVMYRQAIALAIQRERRGKVDVRISPPEAMEEQLAFFRPHLLVHNDTAPSPDGLLASISRRVEVLYSDGMDARIHADGSFIQLSDASIEDLLGAVDGAVSLAEREEEPS
jgi:hypothetical protein